MDGILKYKINLDLKGNYLKVNDKIIDINKKTFLFILYNIFIPFIQSLSHFEIGYMNTL